MPFIHDVSANYHSDKPSECYARRYTCMVHVGTYIALCLYRDSGLWTPRTAIYWSYTVYPSYLFSWAVGRISLVLKNQFKSAVLNKPSVLESMKIYCMLPALFSVVLQEVQCIPSCCSKHGELSPWNLKKRNRRVTEYTLTETKYCHLCHMLRTFLNFSIKRYVVGTH